ncbi:MAG: hypothetical protein KC609_16045 [Myxococcales bacterium]|nr:hypothetical protein [Myxococcales bacterium]
MSLETMVWALVFGSVGLAYFLYGKRQKKSIPLICGLLLMAFPYFVTRRLPLIAIGVLLTAIPYFVRSAN